MLLFLIPVQQINESHRMHPLKGGQSWPLFQWPWPSLKWPLPGEGWAAPGSRAWAPCPSRTAMAAVWSDWGARGAWLDTGQRPAGRTDDHWSSGPSCTELAHLKQKGQRHIYLVHSLSYWWWLMRMEIQGDMKFVCHYMAAFLYEICIQESVQVSQVPKHHTPWLFFSKVFNLSMCTCSTF